ncbi:uncharacterized protein LOC127714255 [Mytilus californianus]|uniref:uncharacterized protein LOC127714255 n=1 Tax=Mytilus californianus TaxID=6549 RepID=UPI0022454038|nr:uncharacterized protein LOC127714255 [Mytilus californianus]
MYGQKCVFTCECQDNQRCHHVNGCIAEVTIPTTENKENDKRIVADQKSKDENVVIYMTCVGVLGLLVVGAITVWKFRQTLFQLIVSWKNRQSLFGLQSNPQQVKFDTEDNERSSKLEQEIMYHVINEKEMMSFCKK